jgi:hypothetical protein
VKNVNVTDSEEDGTLHFMVNVIEPQFNLHSEEANVSCKGSFSIETLFSLETSHPNCYNYWSLFNLCILKKFQSSCP